MDDYKNINGIDNNGYVPNQFDAGSMPANNNGYVSKPADIQSFEPSPYKARKDSWEEIQQWKDNGHAPDSKIGNEGPLEPEEEPLDWMEIEGRKITDQAPLPKSEKFERMGDPKIEYKFDNPGGPATDLPSGFARPDDFSKPVEPAFPGNPFNPFGGPINNGPASDVKGPDVPDFRGLELEGALKNRSWQEVIPPEQKKVVTVDGRTEIVTEPSRVVDHVEAEQVALTRNPFDNNNNAAKKDLTWLRELLTTQDQENYKRLLESRGMNNIDQALEYAKNHNLIEGYGMDEPNKDNPATPGL